MADGPDLFRAAVFGGLPHGFLGCRGGVSHGGVSGLNAGLGAGDDDGAVHANRAIAVAAVLAGSGLATVRQVHSPDCVVVRKPWPDEERPQADALVTDRPGLLLGVVTADCAPVLIADLQAGVVGAAHAGWKGAFNGITDNTITAMESLGAKRRNMVAAIGPCIAQESYEVDDGFMARFCSREPASAALFNPGRAGHQLFDLERYTARRLATAGIDQVERLGLDTYIDAGRFYSFRRATHSGAAHYGRQISLIGLSPS